MSVATEPSLVSADVSLQQAASAARGDGKRDYVQQMFSDIAPRYDLLNHVLSMNIDKGWRLMALQADRKSVV